MTILLVAWNTEACVYPLVGDYRPLSSLCNRLTWTPGVACMEDAAVDMDIADAGCSRMHESGGVQIIMVGLRSGGVTVPAKTLPLLWRAETWGCRDQRPNVDINIILSSRLSFFLTTRASPRMQ